MSTKLETGEVVLEPAAQEFADATSTPPFIYELSPDDAGRSSKASSAPRSTSRTSTIQGMTISAARMATSPCAS